MQSAKVSSAILHLYFTIVTTQVVRFEVHSCPVLDTGFEP